MRQRAIAESEYQQQMPVRYDPDMLREYGETHTTDEIIAELQELQRSRAEHLLRCHTGPAVPPEERKQALYDYCVAVMAEDLLAPGMEEHNPWSYPEWLALAQSRMAEFIMEDIEERQVLAQPWLCNEEEPQHLHNLANSVSASILPLEPHDDDRIFAIGVLKEQIRPWVLPEIRADELTLA